LRLRNPPAKEKTFDGDSPAAPRGFSAGDFGMVFSAEFFAENGVELGMASFFY